MTLQPPHTTRESDGARPYSTVQSRPPLVASASIAIHSLAALHPLHQARPPPVEGSRHDALGSDHDKERCPDATNTISPVQWSILSLGADRRSHCNLR